MSGHLRVALGTEPQGRPCRGGGWRWAQCLPAMGAKSRPSSHLAAAAWAPFPVGRRCSAWSYGRRLRLQRLGLWHGCATLRAETLTAHISTTGCTKLHVPKSPLRQKQALCSKLSSLDVTLPQSTTGPVFSSRVGGEVTAFMRGRWPESGEGRKARLPEQQASRQQEERDRKRNGRKKSDREGHGSASEPAHAPVSGQREGSICSLCSASSSFYSHRYWTGPAVPFLSGCPGRQAVTRIRAKRYCR